MAKLHRTGNHVRQQRLENNVVIAIDERNLRSLQFSRGKHLTKMDGDVNSAEPAAEDENALLCHMWFSAVREETLNQCKCEGNSK
jgi:hypothetical protein